VPRKRRGQSVRGPTVRIYGRREDLAEEVEVACRGAVAGRERRGHVAPRADGRGGRRLVSRRGEGARGGRRCVSRRGEGAREGEVAYIGAARARKADVAYLRAARALGAIRATGAAWLRSVARRPQTPASRRSACFRIRKRARCLRGDGRAGWGRGSRFRATGPSLTGGAVCCREARLCRAGSVQRSGLRGARGGASAAPHAICGPPRGFSRPSPSGRGGGSSRNRLGRRSRSPRSACGRGCSGRPRS